MYLVWKTMHIKIEIMLKGLLFKTNAKLLWKGLMQNQEHIKANDHIIPTSLIKSSQHE